MILQPCSLFRHFGFQSCRDAQWSCILISVKQREEYPFPSSNPNPQLLLGPQVPKPQPNQNPWEAREGRHAVLIVSSAKPHCRLFQRATGMATLIPWGHPSVDPLAPWGLHTWGSRSAGFQCQSRDIGPRALSRASGFQPGAASVPLALLPSPPPLHSALTLCPCSCLPTPGTVVPWRTRAAPDSLRILPMFPGLLRTPSCHEVCESNRL